MLNAHSMLNALTGHRACTALLFRRETEGKNSKARERPVGHSHDLGGEGHNVTLELPKEHIIQEG